VPSKSPPSSTARTPVVRARGDLISLNEGSPHRWRILAAPRALRRRAALAHPRRPLRPPSLKSTASSPLLDPGLALCTRLGPCGRSHLLLARTPAAGIVCSSASVLPPRACHSSAHTRPLHLQAAARHPCTRTHPRETAWQRNCNNLCRKLAATPDLAYRRAQSRRPPSPLPRPLRPASSRHSPHAEPSSQLHRLPSVRGDCSSASAARRSMPLFEPRRALTHARERDLLLSRRTRMHICGCKLL